VDKAPLWPWARLLGLMVVSFVGGQLIDGEHLMSRRSGDKTT
jgi:hypothetical protein